ETFAIVHTIDFGFPAYGEGLRWSPTDPLVLYYTGSLNSGFGPDPDGIPCGVNQARLMRYRLMPGTPLAAKRELVRCFSEYTEFAKDPSYEELSDDGRYIALVGVRSTGQNEVFAYDILNDIKGQTLATSGVDWTAVSPSGKYVLVQYTGGVTRFAGLESYDLNMNFLGKVSTTGGHGDLTMDANGNEFLIQTNAANAYLLSDKHYLIKAKIPVGVLFQPNSLTVDEVATVGTGATVPLLT